ncbi:50S ribosome-binding GTPase, partial [Oryctes borbonicus]
NDKLASAIQKYEDKLLYSGYIEAHSLGYKQSISVMRRAMRAEEKDDLERQRGNILPLSLKYLYTDESTHEGVKEEKNVTPEASEESVPTHFPFEIKDSNIINNDIQIDDKASNVNEYTNLADLEIKERLKHLNTTNWMENYENYDENYNKNNTQEVNYGTPDPKSSVSNVPCGGCGALLHCKDTYYNKNNTQEVNYGTPDPKSSVSNVPCGGCGALLHCKDTSIPGYIPSEIYKNHNKRGAINLRAIICQRCYFLKNYNLALQVQISPEEYPLVLKTIKERHKALVVLIVDLLDIPCSIWPGAADLLGPGQSIFLVGNKVDLLPQDGKGFLQRITDHLRNSAKEAGFANINIKHVAVISATTGFGVEDLITKLHSLWRSQGDVFLVGCTNVGKSSLFNALLQSDYCKSQAVDLIQRATVSPWPGTTLNLLKFPIIRLSGIRSYLRSQRLKATNKQVAEENKLRKEQLSHTSKSKYATLIGHIGRTFSSEEPVAGSGDLFSVRGRSDSVGKVNIGVKENEKIYATSKWCCDTPGVVQPEQLLHLLTAEELLLTLPKELLRPRTFCLHPGSTIFIGGLSRLDYLEGDSFGRFVVFRSHALPITICKTDVADELYNEFLGTEFLKVPTGNTQRLAFWPGLKTTRELTVKSVPMNYCCADVVLSSSGWVAIAGAPDAKYRMKAWVPENCGIYLRDSLLPYAVTLRGKRLRDSPAYRTNK